jgi:hypothetical protein
VQSQRTNGEGKEVVALHLDNHDGDSRRLSDDQNFSNAALL